VWLLNPKCSVIWCTLIAELCFTTSLQYYTEENQTRAIPNFPQSERLRTHLSEKSNSKEIKHDGRRYGERLNGGVEVSPAAFRGWEPEPDGLAARHEKDYEGGDGEEARGAGPRIPLQLLLRAAVEVGWMRAQASKRRKCVEARRC
jgi:hypothetical protein